MSSRLISGAIAGLSLLIVYLRFWLLPIFSRFDYFIAFCLWGIAIILFYFTIFYSKILKFKVKKLAV
jgi:hypothetical protein